MINLSALDLSRLQFAFTVSFHIIFPAMSIGLASFIAVLEAAWLKTGKLHYKELCLFWSKVFAIGFGMGVVSGVVMAYQFGTNWAGFAKFAGPITGPLLTYEVMTAFFLEAGFLGIMLFGWDRVGRSAHFGATLLVAIGTLISTFWILASNSWMQTPQGFTVENGHVVPLDWFKIIFNPSFPYRLAHMAIAAFIVGALLVAAAGAWHLLRGRRDPAVKTMFSMALWLLLVLAPIQALVGDQHGLNTRKYQPAKIAAIEGLWETEHGGTALNLIGFPDMQAEETRYAIQIPHLGSLILTHSWDGEIRGLKEFPAGRPAEFVGYLLDVSHHGGPRHADDPAGRDRPHPAARRPDLRKPAVPALHAGDGAGRLHHADRRLDHDRNGPATVGGVRRVAYGASGVARDPTGRERVADDFRDRLLSGVLHGHLLHLQAAATRAAVRRWSAAPGARHRCEQQWPPSARRGRVTRPQMQPTATSDNRRAAAALTYLKRSTAWT